jgi:Enoyl-CoA hydratase/isomerase
MNLLGPELVRDLVTLIQEAEADDAVQVLVFASAGADPDYFISHVDLNRIAKYRAEAAKLTGEASIALLFRHLSASRLVTIAQIAGRVRAAGSEFVLACDMRFRRPRVGDLQPVRARLRPDPGRGAAQHLTRPRAAPAHWRSCCARRTATPSWPSGTAGSTGRCPSRNSTASSGHSPTRSRDSRPPAGHATAKRSSMSLDEVARPSNARELRSPMRIR